jgi:hypothetical protein
VPAIGKGLYRPQRLITLPETIDVTRTPAIIGVMCSPELVGESPFVTCRYSGRNVTAPKSASPTTKPIALVTANTRFRNRDSGRIGSSARASQATKAAVRTIPETARTAIGTDRQSSVVPPRLVNRTIEDSAPASRAAPT